MKQCDNTRCDNKKGYVLAEVMMFCMVLVIIGNSFLVLVSADYRLTLRQLEKEKAEYAAVSAVRLMEEGVLTEKESVFADDIGIDPVSGTLEFQAEERAVSIPVTIWTEREEHVLTLYAKAGESPFTQTVFLVMEDDDGWKPVRYGIP